MNAKELLDKYIKYNSKITFDIFKLMYQKLIDLKFTTPHDVKYAFEEFSSGKYPYFVMKVYDDYDGKPYFNQYSDVEMPKSEISVEDLLGYNPFESSELPEKWCIKVTEDNKTILWKWRTDSSCSIGYYLLSPYHSYSDSSKVKIGYAVPFIPEDTIEITFDQFKQYVLKEPVMTKSSKPFPSRWCIKLDKTTIPIVGNYYNKKNLKDPNCNTYTKHVEEGCYIRSHNTSGEYVKNGYNHCSFVTESSDEYPEITLEDFKQFVMEETTNKTEKDWSKATKEELLEEAKKRYPMGTEYIPLLSTGEVYNKRSYTVSRSYRYINGGVDCGVGYVYAKGNWAEITYLPDTEVKEVVPEYVECSYSRTETFIVNKIYKCEPRSKVNALNLNSEKGSIISNLPYEGSLWNFKPSTKEAFEAQNKPQSIEKWEKGSYVVCVQDYSTHFKVGDIGQIENVDSYKNNYIDISKSVGKACLPFKANCKWFATLAEAEEFSKTLVKSGENTIECEEGKCTSEITKTRFKKGDYVVSLRPEHLSTLAIKFNHCYIQYTDGNRISVDYGITMYESDPHYARLATPEEIEEYKRVGKPYDVTTLQTSEICTYGLNVGDFLDANIINDWSELDNNKCYLSSKDKSWKKLQGVFMGNRTIQSFKLIDGIVGFLISGTNNVYLRAEGFKEFAENYNKSKESEVKFEIGKWYKVCDGKYKLYNELWYVKSPKIVDGLVKVDQYLYNDCLNEEGNFGYVGDYTFVEVPVSEIQHLLLKCPSDKIEKATQNVVKVNTCKVRITSSEIKVLKF